MGYIIYPMITSFFDAYITPDSQRFRPERNLTEIVHGAENVSLDVFPSVGNLIFAGRILFLARQKLYKEILSVPLHISFVQKLRHVRSVSISPTGHVSMNAASSKFRACDMRNSVRSKNTWSSIQNREIKHIDRNRGPPFITYLL